MITRIQLSGIATYKSLVTIEPKKINFIYGSNGTGKTTLTRFLAESNTTPNSGIEWDSGTHEKVIVYNRNFVEQNFRENESIPGIFTLGSESIDIQNKVAEFKAQQEKTKEEKEKKKSTLSKLQTDLSKLTDQTKDKCWKIQSKYGLTFADALVGCRKSRDNFFKECLSRYAFDLQHQDPVLQYDQLLNVYGPAYSKDIEYRKEYTVLDISDVEVIDNQELLSKIITGKANTPIGTFIQYLNASDWVKQGIALTARANGKCPFCQRELPTDLEKQIADYFDVEYEKDCRALTEYYQRYLAFVKRVKSQIEFILDNKYDFLQYAEFEQYGTHFKLTADRNITEIQSKVEAPSKIIRVAPLEDILVKINSFITGFNDKIKENNRTVANQKDAKQRCQELIWHFFIDVLKDDLAEYSKNKAGVEKGIRALEEKIAEDEKKIYQLEQDIKEEEAKLTSVLPTVEKINRILTSFGFCGFSLAENKDKLGTYVLMRQDGKDASRTLSEGEYNFISFLYFYHLCFGSQTNEGISDDRIIVIDDPVSSLDSNVLFIVATLVKNIIKKCYDDKDGIKQIFVLTHNVYFHKEISYLNSRENYPSSKAAYFIVRKKDEESSIVFFSDNPIKTSYEMLWEDLRKPDERSVQSVFNTMRRILEHYFQIIGGIQYEKCINNFEGEDKQICLSLIASVNEGSHSIFDDLIVPIDETALEKYLRVFRLIFEKLKHIEHYNMMMRKDRNDDSHEEPINK